MEKRLQGLDSSLSEIKYLSLVVKVARNFSWGESTDSHMFYDVPGYKERASAAAQSFPHSARRRLLELLRSRR